MTALLDASIRVSVVLAVALIGSAAMRKRAAAARHGLVAGGVLLSALVAPLSWTLPAWHVQVPAWRVAAGSAFVQTSLRAATVSPDDGVATAGLLVIGVWLAGTIISLLALLFALANLRRIRRSAVPILDGPWRLVADEILTEIRLRRSVILIQAPGQVQVATWGVWRPRIVIPSAAADWSRDHIRAVLRHEIAHIARYDWPIQIAACVLCAWQWFNPLYWMGLRRLRELSEMACDDEALRAGLGPREYALRLVEITRATRPMPLPTAAVPMARPSSLERRIAAMLDPRIDRRPLSRWATATTFVTLLLLIVPAAVLRGAQTAKPSEPAATAPAAKPVTTLKVGGAVKPPRKIHDVKAVYPEAMKEAGISGDVELEVTVGKDGAVSKVHVLTTDVHPDLAVAAVDAVREWKFEPSLLNGAPVDVMVKCTVAFRLKD
jgi:TonB family protein